MAAGRGATDWEEVFGDDLGLSERFTAHSGTGGESNAEEKSNVCGT